MPLPDRPTPRVEAKAPPPLFPPAKLPYKAPPAALQAMSMRLGNALTRALPVEQVTFIASYAQVQSQQQCGMPAKQRRDRATADEAGPHLRAQERRVPCYDKGRRTILRTGARQLGSSTSGASPIAPHGMMPGPQIHYWFKSRMHFHMMFIVTYAATHKYIPQHIYDLGESVKRLCRPVCIFMCSPLCRLVCRPLRRLGCTPWCRLVCRPLRRPCLKPWCRLVCNPF